MTIVETEPTSTGTSTYPYTVETIVPHKASVLMKAFPIVKVQQWTGGETPLIHYQILRGNKPLAAFDGTEKSSYTTSSLRGQVSVVPKERLIVAMVNKEPYTVAPLAGVRLLYYSITSYHSDWI